ncbi:hypothetical protein DER45DRAFT_542019 [Fusarium avenaceum]|nr:hypothetical protein DER45DRAFT_542019 [Fusarium avenaceum]
MIDAAPGLTKYVEEGGNDPRVIEVSEKSQRGAEAAKSDYETRMSNLGPNVRELVQKIEKVDGDITSLKQETVRVVEKATDTMSKKIDSQGGRTVAEIKTILDSQASHVKAMAVNIDSLGDNANKSRIESEGTWNRLFDGLDEAFSKIATREDVRVTKSAVTTGVESLERSFSRLATGEDIRGIESSIAGQVERLPKVDLVQIGRIEVSTSAKLDKLMEKLQEKPTRQEYGDVLKDVIDLSRDNLVLEFQSALAMEFQKVKEETEGTLDTLRYELSRKVQEGLDARDTLRSEQSREVQQGLENLGATAKSAARALFDRTELIREDSERAMASLRAEYEAKLKGKDAEIELLKGSVEDLRKVCADSKTTIERLEAVNSTNSTELKKMAVSCDKFRKQIQENHDYYGQLNNELENRAAIIIAKDKSLEQSLRETNEEVMKNTELATQAELSKKQCERLQADVNRLTQSQSQLLGRINTLRRFYAGTGSEANDISGFFFELGAQLRGLKMDDVAKVEGKEFLALVASKLLRVTCCQRLQYFVDRVQDNKPRCFSEVCLNGRAEPLEGREFEKHGAECLKMLVRIDSTTGEKIVHFPL